MLRRLKLKFIVASMTLITLLICLIFFSVYEITRKNIELDSYQRMQDVIQPADKHSGPNGSDGNTNNDKPAETKNDRETSSDAQPRDKYRDMPEKNLRTMQQPYFMIERSKQGSYTAIGSVSGFNLSNDALLQSLMEQVMQGPEDWGILEEHALRFFRTEGPEQRVLFADITGELATLKDLRHTGMLVCSLSFILLLGICILLARWAVRPVEQAWNQQKQFIADASHELKTPLSVIMTNSELLLDSSYSETQQASFSRNILTTSHQMRTLIQALLELARADCDLPSSVKERVNFSRTVSDAILPFDPLYFEQGLSLEYDIAPDLVLMGSALHLQHLVEILLDNALKYSDPDSLVSLSLRKQGNHCLLQVENSAPDISKADLKNIFKRFYRIDEARQRNGSYGLGLSIAESITKMHDGKIKADSNNGKVTFSVQLPLI